MTTNYSSLRKGLAVTALSCLSVFAFAQGTPAKPAATTTAQATAPAPAVDHSYKPLTVKLNESGSKYVRFIMWHQMWATATQNNPGTLDVNGNDIGGKWTSDVAIRRSRFLAYAQISPRFLILTHWGINNQSFINGGANAGSNVTSAGASNAGKRPQLYIHDAWTEFAVQPTKLHVGMGLHYWNGISRLSNNSTLNFMTMDAPIFNWANIELTDQFARQFGIYAKGQINKIDYRFSVNKPFVVGASAAAKGSNLAAQAKGKEVAVNILNEKTAVQGYVNYMAWDKESNVLPFFVGTYLGAKKVLNFGAGFYTHPDATGYRTSGVSNADSITRNRQMVIGADVFLDMPTAKGKGDCINFMLTYYNMNFGQNYIRNIGILNEHAAISAAAAGSTANSWSGGGNLQPTIGTGSILYGQLGYALPKNKIGHQWMPYATFTYKKFDRLAEASTQGAVGVNWFINGHNAKITAELATRPIYKADAAGLIKTNGSASQFTIQTHLFL
ncbi:MAG: porin [Saprospiraceae bacterium]|nr:porin [Saprospiraceae bacterium]